MLILSGDVLLLFNPLQIDFNYHGAAAISMKENVLTGKDHGVFLNDGNDYVGQDVYKRQFPVCSYRFLITLPISFLITGYSDSENGR